MRLPNYVLASLPMRKRPMVSNQARVRCRKAGTTAIAIGLLIPILWTSVPAAAEPAAKGNGDVQMSSDKVRVGVRVRQGETIYIAETAKDGRLLTPRKSTGNYTLRTRTQPAVGEHIRVAYGVSKKGTIRSRTVFHNDVSVLPDSGQHGVQWSASMTSVDLTWWKPINAQVKWRIFRDGKLLSSNIDGTSYRDATGAIEREKQHVYTITGSEILQRDGRSYERPYYYQVAVPPSDSRSIGRSITDQAVALPSHNRDVATAPKTLPTGIVTSRSSTLTYNAFIADPYVDAPPWCLPNNINAKYFAGDNRAFFPGSGNGRSRLRGVLGQSWSSDGRYYQYPNQLVTGITVSYDANLRVLESATAPASGIYVTGDTHGTSARGAVLEFHSANPLCSAAPAIDAQVQQTMSATGAFRIKGQHDQAPSHEAWFEYYNSATKFSVLPRCAYRFENKGFYNLAPPAPNAIFDVSWNPVTNSYPDCLVR